MILAFAYIVLGAKPISFRRLFLLYVFSIATADFVLATFHAVHAAMLASQIATFITLAAWSYPFLRVLHNVFRGRIELEALEPVSICVRATYGFAVVITIAAGVKALVAPFDPLTFAAFSQFVVIGLTVSTGFVLLAPPFRRSPRSEVTRGGFVRHGVARLPSK